VYQKCVCDVDELKQRLVEVWSHFSRAITDEAIDAMSRAAAETTSDMPPNERTSF